MWVELDELVFATNPLKIELLQDGMENLLKKAGCTEWSDGPGSKKQWKVEKMPKFPNIYGLVFREVRT